MKTAIVYYSAHHGNTKKLLDAIRDADPEITLIDVTAPADDDLTEYDRIGLASGIYFSAFAKQLLGFAEAYLPEGKPVFYVYTHGALKGDFLKAVRRIAAKKHCRELGEYRCQGYDTFGPFKLVGGLAKGHPTAEEVEASVRFYKGLGQ